MRKKKTIQELYPDVSAIKIPRQLAKVYMEKNLPNFFVWSRFDFFKELDDRPFKKQLDAHEIKIASSIIELVKEKQLSKVAVSIIEGMPNKEVIYFALHDFGLAIGNFQTVMRYVIDHNKMFKREKGKALSCLKKLLINYAVGVLDKKELNRIKEKILCTPSERGYSYYPLYFFDFLRDLGWLAGEKIDESYLRDRLHGLHVSLDINFPRNRRNDLFIFHALQIIIYDLLAQHIRIDIREVPTRNVKAEDTTACIINSYVSKRRLKDLPKLTGKAVYNTLLINLP